MYATENKLRLIEELTLNHWQPLSTSLYDGWVLRFAEGYSKRANSVQPLYPSTLDVHEKIKACENIYSSNQLNTIFKMTPFVQPEQLDQLLQDKGYVVVDKTLVQLRDLKDLKVPEHLEAHINEQLTEEWLDHFCRLNAVSEEFRATMTQMLFNVRAMTGFITLSVDGCIVACGLGVVERGFIGLHDIITDPDYRNRGLAEQMILHLLHWGKSHGATSSYLQVVEGNAAARRLYAKLGYTDAYSYWYRVKNYT
ncbi:GNAT family N-acetyltransferase [Paenibacillus polysaccharolyticus]|uniref:GNAT family N-acetyltransferase n=1 Tax=Paenibacillus polysaccharolyticus TaxID=582692 RepID=UPI0020A15ABD|nr:GNAT family N-acetyltransferase [Paenibacillus polysaccharolyticus]MCP1135926.1 GNAT family N-acetyltransferase [Paenibacillus polysaccharolyticus]